MITTLLAFLLTLGVLIVVHEYGHYRVAVACGVRVLRFSVGFGRVVWRRQATPESTEFVVCALPLGGYVRMLDEREGPVAPQQRGRAFNQQPLMRRVAIVAAGPLANLLLAVVLYAAAGWIGLSEPKALLGALPPGSAAQSAGLKTGDWVRAWSADGLQWQDLRSMNELRWAVTQAVLEGRPLHLALTDRDGRGSRQALVDLGAPRSSEVDAARMRALGFGAPFSEPVLGEVKSAGPASAAGLRAGDRVRSIDGREMPDAAMVREAIRNSVQGDRAVAQRWVVERDGRTLELDVTARVALDGERAVGRIDAYVGLPPEMVTVRHGALEGLVSGVERTWELASMTLRMIGRMLTGQASLKNLSGPITISDVAGQSVQQGLAYYLGFLALVSVSLGVLNLLPLPMLDGGHLMYYFFEGLTGRPIPDRWMERLQRGGIAVLVALMSVALFNDVVRLLGLH